MWDRIASSLLNLDLWTTVGTVVAAIAAWRAAASSREATKVAAESVELSRRELAEKDLPKIVAVFRLTKDDQLFLDVSNFGGLATNLKLGHPIPVDPQDERRKHIFLASKELVGQSPALKHGIGLLRPGETIPILVGRYLSTALQDDFASEYLDTALSDSVIPRGPIEYSIQYTSDQVNGQISLILDRTAEMRLDLTRQI